MTPIGGDIPKFLSVVESADDRVRVEVTNPHLVTIGELTAEIRDGKIVITTASADHLEFVVIRP
ncbi:hypothetical protein ACWT_4591 [Actinoplanes sp. SE50]|uniref:hypothetical protein n=1 Tax=unclassified Actinoplanes TaxID=2626549 RepID=UPI00023ED475|nr:MULTISPECIES: hypothetical protein [unclassified Actinoplanes]AEV85613.1 hypothetical protein ACPL_4722 [Actinoplanes sp. SE50/110]ATO84006.1 hypothetical protein ACWT_4591 [Actinoplanes sp. SE50]SLM01416.1 hypothetical protein ACSP50_4652 [Actinoplanes sp. SE50/110]